MSDVEKIEEPTEAATAEAQAGEQVETDIQGVFDQVQKLTDERDQLRDQVLRAMADFKNFRTRVETEKRESLKYASQKLAVDLIPVLDNFERTVAHLQKGATVEQMEGGIRAVERQFRSVLEAQGIKRIESVGQPFDTERHEALGFAETEEFEEGHVASEIEPGYTMHDKVIRPARVRVAQKP
jgi:molecular chaperone GrpE